LAESRLGAAVGWTAGTAPRTRAGAPGGAGRAGAARAEGAAGEVGAAAGAAAGGRRRCHVHVAHVVLALVVAQLVQQGGRDALEHLESRHLLLVEAFCAVARAEALEEVAERALDHRDLLGQELYLRFLLREGSRREVQRAGDLGVRVREGFEVGGKGVSVHGRGLDGNARAAASPEALRR
jgi:hypothetical protein